MRTHDSSRVIVRYRSFRQLENNVYQRSRIVWLSISLCGMEADLLRRAQGRLIQSVAESPHYALHAQLAGGGKRDFDEHFTFNAKLASFRGVGRFRLEENFHGDGVRLSVAASSRSRCGRGHVVKAAGLYRTPV